MVGDIPLFASGRHQVQPRLENYPFLTPWLEIEKSSLYRAARVRSREGFLALRQ
jgi:hypothetical protein